MYNLAQTFQTRKKLNDKNFFLDHSTTYHNKKT